MEENIGDLIYSRRKELGLTLEDIAQKVGVERSTVRKWEKGMIKSIRSDKLESLADALQISPVRLVPGKKKFRDIMMEDLGEKTVVVNIPGAGYEEPLFSSINKTNRGMEAPIGKVVGVNADPELNNMLKIWKVSSPKARKAAVEMLRVMSDVDE